MFGMGFPSIQPHLKSESAILVVLSFAQIAQNRARVNLQMILIQLTPWFKTTATQG